jgi:hypothetical protein
MPPPWPASGPVSVILDVTGDSITSVTLWSRGFSMRLVVRHGTLLIALVAPA